MKKENYSPGFTADLTYSVAKFSYLSSLNTQTKENGSILMQRLRLPSSMRRFSLLTYYYDGADCYNDASRKCNTRYPGKDMSDPEYSACINTELEICDIRFPV